MTDLFTEAPETTEASQREELLNKWKDKPVEELLKAKVDADLFINTLTKRQDDLSKDYLAMKTQLDATASLQELRDQIVSKATSNSESPNANEGNESQKTAPVDLEGEFKKLYEKTRIVEKQLDNVNAVQAKLKDRFGNSYQQVLRDTGLSDTRIREIAAESPEAIYRLVGLDNRERESFQAPPRSAERSSFTPRGQPKRDWNYYQELKKTNPKLYLDPKIAVQMHNDAIALGDDFGI